MSFQRVLFILVVLAGTLFSDGIFPIATIEPSLNQIDFVIGVRGVEVENATCQINTGPNISCTHNFDLIFPQWIEKHQNSTTVYTPKNFILSNPNTQVDRGCSAIAAGTDINLVFNIATKNGTPKLDLDVPVEPTFVNTQLNYVSNVTGLTCARYTFQVYNPKFVEKDRIWLYPFDSYIARFGFDFPNAPSFQGIINVPESFTITNVSINNATGDRMVIPNENSIYFNSGSALSKSEMFEIKFERSPSWSGSWIISGLVVFGLPLLLLLSIFFPKKMENSKVAIVLIPAFISFIPILLNHPNSFMTLFDQSLLLTIALLGYSLWRDGLKNLINSAWDSIWSCR